MMGLEDGERYHSQSNNPLLVKENKLYTMDVDDNEPALIVLLVCKKIRLMFLIMTVKTTPLRMLRRYQSLQTR